MPAIRNALKKLRGSQPFNFLATSVLHESMRVMDLRSEFLIKHLHRVGKVRTTLPNGRSLLLWSRGDDWVSNQVYWRGWSGYEPETTPIFFRLAQSANVTIDVGAYVGYFTLLAAHANPRGRVFAFEPLNEIYERLIRNVRLNLLDNVECTECAVAEVEGRAEFFHHTTHMPTSSSLSYEFMHSSAGSAELVSSNVPLVSIDRFVREKKIDRVDLVKIDTESTEPQVLRGMSATLHKDHPAIVCEVLPGRGTETILEEILEPLGYRYYLLTPDGPIEREEIQGHPEWLNYLFVDRSRTHLAPLVNPQASCTQIDDTIAGSASSAGCSVLDRAWGQTQ